MLGEMIATMAPPFTSQARRQAEALALPFEDVAFETDDGLTLRGWFFPAAEPSAPAVLYAPATARDQTSGLSLVSPLHAAGYHVLLFSYRGHGMSEGSRVGFTYGARESRDVDAAVAYLSEVRHITRIVAIGHSAGAVSVLISAARNPRIDAVVAVSPFPSVEQVWENNRPSFFLPAYYDLVLRLAEWRKGFSRQQVQPIELIARISPRPVLLVHGTADKRIPVEQALQLFQAARAPKAFWLVEGATHSSVRSPALELILPEVIAFLSRGDLASAFEYTGFPPMD